MKTIFLKRITLENWRAQNTTMEFSKDVSEVRAKNGVGKSSLFNAFLWLVTGADSLDRTNFDLFDTTQPITKDTPTASVEVVLEVDGDDWKLKRTAKSQWILKKDKGIYEKASSDKYSFFVDDCEVQAKSFQERISGLFGELDFDTIKMCINPNQSNNMDWKELRKMFQRIIGEIKESDFQGDYTAIKEAVSKLGFEEAKAAARNRANDFDKNEKTIKIEVSALQKTLPDVSQCDEAQRQIDLRKAKIEELDKTIMGIGDANKPFIEQRQKQEAEYNAKLAELNEKRRAFLSERERFVSSIESEVSGILREAKEVKAYNASLESKKKELEKDILDIKGDIAFLDEQIEELRKQNRAKKELQFSEELTCPTCGQPLPVEQVADARAKLIEKNEAERMVIVKHGKELSVKKEQREARLSELQQTLASLAPKPEIDTTEAEAKVKEARENAPVFEIQEEAMRLKEEMEQMKQNFVEIPETEDTSVYVEEKSKLLDEIETFAKITGLRKTREDTLAIIAVREKEHDATAQALAYEMFLISKFTEYERERASIISERANKFLKCTNVKMMQQNKNGEWSDCCVVTVNGVGSTMNQASGIVAGVDVAHAFQRYFDISAPIFVDCCDAIDPDLIPETDGQQIRLVFDKNYQQLTLV
jgi:hypothetical protein